jgi:choline dehydrogenase-like flavoprotein
VFIELAREQPNGPLKSDIAVVGSGPAGMALALRLEALGRNVLILESGGFDYSEAVQELNDGDDVSGRTNYLRTSRVRIFGGTSFAWAGWCAPLDSIDFESRSWIKDGEWPISSADLAKHYRDAAALCELSDGQFETPYWKRKRGQPELDWKGGEWSTAYFQLSPPTRFGS